MNSSSHKENREQEQPQADTPGSNNSQRTVEDLLERAKTWTPPPRKPRSKAREHRAVLEELLKRDYKVADMVLFFRAADAPKIGGGSIRRVLAEIDRDERAKRAERGKQNRRNKTGGESAKDGGTKP